MPVDGYPAAAYLPPIVDAHNDLLMLVHHFGDDPTYFRTAWLPQLKSGGVRIQVLPVYVEDTLPADAALHQVLRRLEEARALADRNHDAVLVCQHPDDIDEALESGRIGLLLALEGCVALDQDVELLRVLYRLGLRMASLTHVGRTALADGSAEEATRSRLTAAGIAAVRLMESLGILVDVSHLSVDGLRHVLEIATRPMVASHSCARALCEHHRNIPDAELKAIGDAGGVVGVTAVARFVDAKRATLERVIDHIEHIANVAGIHHVGLGMDFFEEIAGTLPPNDSISRHPVEGLANPQALPTLWEALLRRGFSDADAADVMGGNFIRIFKNELGIPQAGPG